MDLSLYHLIFLILPVVVFLSACTDIAYYKIPNSFNAVLCIGFYLFAFLNPNFTLEMIGYHSLTAFIVLCITFGLFALGLFGGGDAKLIAAISLWLGRSDIIDFILFTILAGGVVSVLLLLWRRTKPLKFYKRIKILSSLYYGPDGDISDSLKKRAIPYAVAIMIGLFVVLPKQDIFIELISFLISH